MTASIKDVARECEVSVSTVSRALNGYLDVKEETRKKIQMVAKELGYTPNIIAKNLSSKTHKNIAILFSGYVTPDKLEYFNHNLLRGVCACVNNRKDTIAMYSINSEMQKDRSLSNFCSEYSLSGVLILGLKTTDPYFKEMEEVSIPCVAIDLSMKKQFKHIVSVRTNDTQAFEDITDFVLERGHKKIALVKGKNDAQVTSLREEGLLRSIARHGIAKKDLTYIYGEFTEEIAYEKTREYLQSVSPEERVTAFICMSDLMAIGVEQAVISLGYRVPEDFSITGFDGMDALEYIKPGLVTVDQNVQKKGYVAMETLQRLLNNEEFPKEIYIQHSIVDRESVQKLNI